MVGIAIEMLSKKTGGWERGQSQSISSSLTLPHMLYIADAVYLAYLHISLGSRSNKVPRVLTF